MNENLMTEVVGGEPYIFVPLGAYVVRAVGVCSGRPTFKYTRVEIAGVMDRIADGESVDEIARGFEGYISHGAIVEAIGIVSKTQNNIHSSVRACIQDFALFGDFAQEETVQGNTLFQRLGRTNH